MVELGHCPGFLAMWGHRLCLVIGWSHGPGSLNTVAVYVQQSDKAIGWIPLLSRIIIWALWLRMVVGWALWLDKAVG